MGILSHRVERSDLKAGDHIYSWRTAYAYSHHGIYVGGNKVVHFTHDQYLSSTGHSSSIWFSSSVSNVPAACLNIPDCGFRKHNSGVTMSCLNCFLASGVLYRFEYGVNRISFLAKLRGGTCTTAKSDPPESVIHRAMYLLHNGFGNYNLFTNNCEDFALYCKTGFLVRGQEPLGSSGQASSIIGAPLAAILSLPLQLFVSSPVATATAMAAMYSLNRYAADIGVRDDVIEVKVEDIALFHGNQLDREDEYSDTGTRPEKRQRQC
ncbi:hypothetical protein CDL12_25284 [Handroanthus impetiginosus]|uniref:LRAT domain-containing protein n=1 Tax=Handroanthus impetiginosus TaxID=429701 RepID=A0A2G9GAH9_9LAMI|nr:hypothetical protein CDL12_25284 [Handroanthus impetiginosus]